MCAWFWEGEPVLAIGVSTGGDTEGGLPCRTCVGADRQFRLLQCITMLHKFMCISNKTLSDWVHDHSMSVHHCKFVSWKVSKHICVLHMY